MGRTLRTIAVACVLLAGGVGLAIGAIHLGRDGPTAGAWARLHPHRALAADAVPIAAAIDAVVDERGRPPRDTPELLECLRGAPLAHLRWSDEGALLDPWGRPMLLKVHHFTALSVWSVRVYSAGPDGVDDAGFHDDVELDLGFGP